MSSIVDDRIVKMQFDGTGFEAGAKKALETLDKLTGALKLDGAFSELDNIKKSISGFNMNPVLSSLEVTKRGFSAWDSFVSGIFIGLGKKAVDYGEKIVRKIGRALTKSARDGFGEYQQQMKSVQTIAANSGASLDVIQKNLDSLNAYADKTSYVFSDMTSAIGRFTSAGIDVDKATVAIQGFFNAAALSGAGTQEASRGVYQLSQAMSAGVVKLQDWKSIENASIDTENFRQVIMLTAKHMGVTDKKFKQAAAGTMSFRESLSSGWLTADVMQAALENLTMSTMDYTDAEKGMDELTKKLVSEGYTKEQAEQIIKIATAADASAREVRTWSQLMETLGESMGSGWAKTWELIIGNYEQSAAFFTDLSKRFSSVVDASANARNAVVKQWQQAGGRTALIGGIFNLIEAIERLITPIKDAFSDVFGVSGKQLAVLTENIAVFLEHMVISENTMKIINVTFHDLFMIIHSILGILGNGVRVASTFAKAFFNGFLGIKSIFGSLSNDILFPVSNFLYDLHKKTDDIADTVEKWLKRFNKYQSKMSNLISGNADNTKILEFTSKYAKWLNEDILNVVRFGESAHIAVWELYEVVKSFGKYLVNNGSKILSGIFNIFKENKETIFSTVSNLITLVFNAYKIIKSLARVAWSNIKTIVVLTAPIRKFASFVLSTIVFKAIPLLISGITKVTSVISEVVDKASDIYVRMFRPIRRIFKELQDIIGGFFTAAYQVFLGPAIQKLAGAFDSIKSFISGLFPEFKGFKHTIAWYFIHPFKMIKDALVSFGGDDRVAFFKTWFENITNTVGGPFTAVFKGAAWVIEKLVDVLSGPLGTAFSYVKDFLLGLDWSTPFSFITDLFSSIDITNPFENFKIPAKLAKKLDNIKEKFLDLSTSAEDGRVSLKRFMKQAGSKIKTSGKNGLDWVMTRLKNSWKQLKNYFGDLRTNGNSFSQNVKKVFGDAYNALSEWIHKLADTNEGFGGAIASAIAFVLDQLGKIPELLGSLFGKTKSAADDGLDKVSSSVDGVSKKAEEFATEQKTFWQTFTDSFPSLSDIIAKIGDLFTGIKNYISDNIGGVFGEDSKVDSSLFKSSLTGLFDFSDFKIVFPDLATPAGEFVDSFSDVLDKFPDERIDTIITRLTDWSKRLGGLAIGVSAWKFVGSLSKLNKGWGEAGKGLGTAMSEMPELIKTFLPTLGKAFGHDAGDSIKKGMEALSGGFKAFGSETLKKSIFSHSKGQEFKRVAEGILILAGALWVMSKVPADSLIASGEALAALAAGIVVLIAALSVVNDKLSQGYIQEIGIAVGAIGVGLLAFAASVFVLSKLGLFDYMKAMPAIVTLMIFMAGSIAAIGAAGKNTDFKSASLSLLALAVAINLMVVPVLLFGFLWTKYHDIIENGISAVGLLAIFFGGAIFAISKIASDGNGKDIALASVTLLALAVAIGLLTPVVLALGALGQTAAIGTFFVGAIAAILTGCFYWLSMLSTNTKEILAGGAAIVLLSIAIALLGPVVVALGGLHEWAAAGTGAVAVLAAILTGCIIALTRWSGEKGKLVQAGAAMILLAVALDAAAIAVLVLGTFKTVSQNGVAAVFILSVILTGVIIVLSKFVDNIGKVYASIGAMALLTIVIAGLAAVMVALSGVCAINLEGMNKAMQVLLEIFVGLAAILAIAGTLGGNLLAAGGAFVLFSVGLISLAGALMLLEQVNFDYLASKWCSLWDAFSQTRGGQVVIGFFNGIFDFILWIERAANAIWEAFKKAMDAAFGFGSPSKETHKRGEWTIEGFVNGVAEKLGLMDESGNVSADTFLSKFEEFDIPGKLAGIAGSAVTKFSEQFKGTPIGDTVKKFSEEGVEGLINGFDISKVSGKISEFVTTVINYIGDEITKPANIEKLKKLGGAVYEGFIEGMFPTFSALANGKLNAAVQEWGQSWISSVDSTFEINSPSKLAMRKGNSVLEGFIEGLKDETLLSSLATAASSLGSIVTNGLSWLSDKMGIKASESKTSFFNSFSSEDQRGSKAGETLATSVSNGVAKLSSLLSGKGIEGSEQLVLGVSAGANKVRDAGLLLANKGKTGAAPLPKYMKKSGSDGSKGMATGISSNSSKVKSSSSSLVNVAKRAVGNLYRTFKDVGRGAGEGFISGINSYIGAAARKAAELANAAKKAAKKALKQNSPSKEFRDIGLGVGEGFVLGVEKSIKPVVKSTSTLAKKSIDSFEGALTTAAIDIEDILDTDYNPVITPVINPTQFDYDLSMLSSRLNGGIVRDLNVGNLNYTGEIIGKFDDIAELNRSAMDQLAANAIDYNRLGVSVANALINAGVHVEMDGGQLMGYLAGEIADASRMQGRR